MLKIGDRVRIVSMPGGRFHQFAGSIGTIDSKDTNTWTIGWAEWRDQHPDDTPWRIKLDPPSHSAWAFASCLELVEEQPELEIVLE